MPKSSGATQTARSTPAPTPNRSNKAQPSTTFRERNLDSINKSWINGGRGLSLEEAKTMPTDVMWQHDPETGKILRDAQGNLVLEPSSDGRGGWHSVVNRPAGSSGRNFDPANSWQQAPQQQFGYMPPQQAMQSFGGFTHYQPPYQPPYNPYTYAGLSAGPMAPNPNGLNPYLRGW